MFGVIHSKMIVGHHKKILISLLVSAFLIRIGVRVFFGETYFWANGYYFDYKIAETLISGGRFCLDTSCAPVTPGFPFFLAGTVLLGKNYLLIIIPEALMGAGTALCAFLIGRHIFNSATGLFACAITAFYPYYVMHDTALQDTGMATFSTALSVWLVFRASRLDRTKNWLWAGLALGATALVRAAVVPVIGVTLLWAAVWGEQGTVQKRLWWCVVLLFGVVLLVGPWLIRNYRVTGAIVLSSETGYMLWRGNNPQTFSRYPAESMDASTAEAWDNMPPADQAEFKRLEHDEIAQSHWFTDRALSFIRAQPVLALQGAFLKLEAAFSWKLNPHRGFLAEATYAAGYVPISILGVLGMFLARRRREVLFIGMMFLAFMCVTAVFFANTSQRTYLDIYLIVFAAFVLDIVRMHLLHKRPRPERPLVPPSVVASTAGG